MKALYNVVVLLGATLASAQAQVVTTNLANLPHYPSPWRIENNIIRDGRGAQVSAAGVNVLGYSNYPVSKSQAATWAKKIDELGVRVYRAHKVDAGFFDNWDAHSMRFQWLLDALKERKIPVITEIAATHEYWKMDRLSAGDLTKWRPLAAKICSLDLSNVVAISPINEPWPTTEKVFRTQYDYLRKLGYKGLIFGSNSMVQRGPAGDFADGHYYCGLVGNKTDFKNIEWKDEPWNHPKPQKLPIMATEIGHQWPAATRYKSEWQIIESLRRVKAQVIIMFALIDNVDEWTTARKPLDKDSFHNDPQRMETLARLVHLMAGVDYRPRAVK